ncbi:MAG: type II toxin-antitoxin system VapC family toxin [Betaproteobacteria bacterium]|jgi:predicted nucleic acid-binding protein|uniref:Type II toxin-antitoxin system VapC family toxin n=1 Tax=Candidatus Proximibacter danicus TaxID=2954365 RepID=A0A9D7K123_9PROT|nr:type II toxin-antitoxin system VapC family toxin [Candidatus Proximibacter danicus]
MLLVDTNVLVDILENDPEWADWSIAQLRAQSKVHRLAINPVIYAELSLTFSTVEALDETIKDLGLSMIELPRPALFLAGKAFVRYRRQGGSKSNVLADFFIGAHAAVSRYPLLTRDTRRYSSYFSEVKLITPSIAT